ncbi:phage regulatory CII family protein [Photobacterium atrarenae]|uniref:Uncharacterized protein n=1 Tax=Photobacterium atrarenae TaxID=865757 RepID=A0ABY5GMQ3_9GAMM|nr:phage regulatory CII family protein [Photobacterium atrarenae]UTV30577.1 hypothetical protein NNL38_18610 [Photobacterium atrarenae]
MDKDSLLTGFSRSLHLQSKEFGIEKLFNEVKVMSGKNISPRTFSNKINPAQAGHQLTLQEFMLTMKVLQQEERHVFILDEMLKLFGLQCERIETGELHEITYRNVLNAWMDWDKERGDVQQEIRAALSDGKVSANELEEIKKEMSQDIDAMIKLRDMLEFACENRINIK